MNKQRREHSHPSYVCFSAAHDFAVGDVGAVYKILFINSYTKKNNMTVIDKGNTSLQMTHCANILQKKNRL